MIAAEDQASTALRETIEWHRVEDKLPDSETTAACKRCGKAFAVKRQGRPERYCSWNCRYNISYICPFGHEVNAANRLAHKINGSRCRECTRLARVRHICVPELRKGADREYRIWRGMHNRCERIDHSSYKRYGARGINVCERWSLFENFIVDMGRAPSSRHQIDRIDNNGNYEPSNCRWITPKENCASRSSAILITVDGVTRIAYDWAKHFGITHQRIYRLIHKLGAVEAIRLLQRQISA